MFQAFGFLAALLIGFLFGRFLGYRLQNHGEAIVSDVLTKTFPPPMYHLLNNLTIPVKDGTTQIDHVLVSRFGVFVIETKHYQGWIFADSKSPKWTQVVFNKKNKFQNPLYQNYKHLKSVQALLDFLPPECIKPVVVFSGNGEFRTPLPEGVFNLRGLLAYFQGFKSEVMSENRLQFCVGRLECCRLALTRETDVMHRENLQRRFGKSA